MKDFVLFVDGEEIHGEGQLPWIELRQRLGVIEPSIARVSRIEAHAISAHTVLLPGEIRRLIAVPADASDEDTAKSFCAALAHVGVKLSYTSIYGEQLIDGFGQIPLTRSERHMYERSNGDG